MPWTHYRTKNVGIGADAEYGHAQHRLHNGVGRVGPQASCLLEQTMDHINKVLAAVG
jgi:hypothetical protein